MLMNERDKEALLLAMTFQVSYDGYSHQTHYHGAFSLLDNRLRYAGVIRDAKAAVLRAFYSKCISGNWDLPFEAGVITITRVQK